MTIYINVNGVDIEAKGDQLAEVLATQTEIQAQMQAIEEQITAKEQAKESAITKLIALGLTEEEALALGAK
jgi:hypothetical protein